MLKTLKKYNKLKIKQELKKQNVLFVCSGMKSQTKSWVPVRKKTTNLGLKTYKVTNKVAKEILINTKTFKSKHLFSSSVITFKMNKNSNLKSLADLKSTKLSILAIKIKNKFYPQLWFKKIRHLNYFNVLKKIPITTNNSLKLFSKNKNLTVKNLT